MTEKQNYCPICNQYRKLRSIHNIYDRIHGMIISRHWKSVDYICYPCRKKIEKGIKEGKRFTELRGPDFIVSGYGLSKYMNEIKNEFKIEIILIHKALGLIDYIYSKWVEISGTDKVKYHIASLLILLEEDDRYSKILEFIKKKYANVSLDEVKLKIKEISEWAKTPNLLKDLYNHL